MELKSQCLGCAGFSSRYFFWFINLLYYNHQMIAQRFHINSINYPFQPQVLNPSFCNSLFPQIYSHYFYEDQLNSGLNNKIMSSDNMLSHFSKTDRLENFISSAKRNGYLQQVKQLSRRTIGEQNSFDRDYRKKVTAYYSKKLTKPFRLIDQPQFLHELRFNSDFNAFVKSIPYFQKIDQQPIYNLPEMSLEQKQVHSETLLYHVEKTSEIFKDRHHKIQPKKSKKQPTIDQQTFPTKINLTQNLKLNTKLRNELESRIEININSGIRSQTQVSPHSHSIPLKPPNSNAHKKFLLQSRKSLITSISPSSSSLLSSAFISIPSLLQNLNKLTQTDHKLQNYRISKLKLHELLIKKFNQDYITNFFSLQTIEDVHGIARVLKEVLGNKKLGLLLTFLHFDSNQDGVITQDQLMRIGQMGDTDGETDRGIMDDVNLIVRYAMERDKDQYKEEKGNWGIADLPIGFIKNPTYKEFMKMSQPNKIRNAGKARGVYRLFSLKSDIQEDNQKQILPSITQKTIDIQKKQIRINFHHFQKAFQHVPQPKFLISLITFLGGKNYNKSQLEPEASPRKIAYSNNKRPRKATFSYDPRLISFTMNFTEEVDKISRAQQMLGTLHKEKKNLATIHYQ